jgi:BTB/POZ domain
LQRKEVAKHVRDNNLRHSLLQFQKDGYLCDTVLVGDGGRVKVHGIVLAAASDMFKGLLKSHEKPSENILVLPGVEQDLLNIIVHLAYTGDIVMPGANMTSEEVSRVVKVLLELGFTLPSLSDEYVFTALV